MKMPERIETERLVLRKPRTDDAHAIFAGWAQDQEVTRYLTWRPHQRIEQTQEFIQGCFSAWEHERRFPYMIALKENDQVIGMIDPRIEGPKMGIGYVAARAFWGISAAIHLSRLCNDRHRTCRFTACVGESWDAMRRNFAEIHSSSEYQ